MSGKDLGREFYDETGRRLIGEQVARLSARYDGSLDLARMHYLAVGGRLYIKLVDALCERERPDVNN